VALGCLAVPPRAEEPEEFDVTETQSQTETSSQELTESKSLITEGQGNGHAADAAAQHESASADPNPTSAAEEEEDGAEDEGSDEVGDPDGARPAGTKRSSLRRLEEEGEVAADYLEELLDIADIDGDIDIDVENGRASVGIVAESSADRSLRRLVGPNGEVLEALQELTRLAVQAATGERSRLMLDVAGFRAGRRRTLEGVADRACQEVQRTGEPHHLDPMSAFERKVVHDVVADAGLISESEGEDPHRHVVIKRA
jgi:spoIIIJ-associated protein